ncbi:MAG: ribonuclease Y [Chloroflexota bacterium]
METLLWLFLLALALLAGGAAGFFGRQIITGRRVQAAEQAANRLIAEARAKQKEILLEAKDEAIRVRNQAEAELRERRAELQRQERRLAQKEENLERRAEALERRERAVAQREREIESLRAKAEHLATLQQKELERVAGLSREEAKQLLLRSVEAEAREEAARLVRQIEQEAREEGERRARNILATAMQRLAAEVTSELTVSVVPLPNEEMKGRIIGREGRNIRALENATGVDIVIDETPDCVTLSGFDPIRREVARIALTRLISDGRIHPARIEEVVAKARQEVEASLLEDGQQAAAEVGVTGLPPEVLRTLGRLKYRYSYGQNVYYHSIECAKLAGLIATEIGADVDLAKKGALLHDIGKALDQDFEGPHALAGAEFCRKHGVSAKVVNCIAAHHGDEEPATVEAVIVAIADAISGSRPGARRESLEHYIRRIEALEKIATSFEGVEKAYAIQAGREVRIIVKPDQVDDLSAMRLARDIARRLEESLEYPGQIKVTVIRETRAVDIAR